MSYIEFKHIDKSYNSTIVFQDFSSSIELGKITALLAPSGVGKTTLLRLIMGLESPDRGEILGLDGREIRAVFQEDRLLEHLSGLANIRIATQIDKNVIQSALEDVGLSEFTNHLVSELSGGMKRRVALLRAILSNWDILVLDEPFKGLDDESKSVAIHFLLKHRRNRTIIFVTHQEDECQLLGVDHYITLPKRE